MSAKRLPKILVIVGPTASGKTGLAIKLAEKFNGEIVSADSRQIYRGMDIGTAKGKERIAKSRVAVRLIDIKNPDEDYTVAEYKKDAVAAIRKILRLGKLPILTGGTGLYVKTVVDNLDIPKVRANPVLRKKLGEKMRQCGLAALFRELVRLDPEAAHIVDPRNPRRVIRALEITLATKKPFSAQRKKGARLFEPLIIGLAVPGEKLRKRINTRVDQMFHNGLVNEVKNLIKKYGSNRKAFDAIGYCEITDYLHGKTTLAEAAESIKKNTWGYAKRQMTWFKKDKNTRWLKNERGAEKLVGKFLAKT
jgi:tRNA dimethylallyltransferase